MRIYVVFMVVASFFTPYSTTMELDTIKWQTCPARHFYPHDTILLESTANTMRHAIRSIWTFASLFDLHFGGGGFCFENMYFQDTILQGG